MQEKGTLICKELYEGVFTMRIAGGWVRQKINTGCNLLFLGV